jgi:hypothetical protein
MSSNTLAKSPEVKVFVSLYENINRKKPSVQTNQDCKPMIRHMQYITAVTMVIPVGRGRGTRILKILNPLIGTILT